MKFSIATTMLVSCSTLIGACASLEVHPIERVNRAGIPYYLPLTQFDISVERRVATCAADGIQIATNVSAVTRTSDDPANGYSIDPQSLSHFFNASSMKVVFHEGTRQLKTINASVEDKAGPAIVASAKILASVASIVLTSGASGLEVAAGIKSFMALDEYTETEDEKDPWAGKPWQEACDRLKVVEDQQDEVRKTTLDLEAVILSAARAVKPPSYVPVLDRVSGTGGRIFNA